MLGASPLTAADTHGILLRPEHQILERSDELAWSTLYASRQVEQPYKGAFAAKQDHLVIVHLSGPVTVERVVEGRRSRAVVHTGGVFLMPAGCDFEVQLGGKLETIHLYVRGELLRSAAAEICKGDPDSVAIIPRLGVHDPLIEHLGRACCQMLSDRQTDFFADGVARLVAAQLIRAHSTGTRLSPFPVTGLSDAQIAKVRTLVEDRLEHPIGIEDMARCIGLNASNFSRQFKCKTGKTPYQYLIEVRLARARGLLETNMPIAEIAIATGFSHQEHLTRLFGRHFGIPPGAYRRQSAN
jgi:AraC family transcriptional regulator